MAVLRLPGGGPSRARGAGVGRRRRSLASKTASEQYDQFRTAFPFAAKVRSVGRMSASMSQPDSTHLMGSESDKSPGVLLSSLMANAA